MNSFNMAWQKEPVPVSSELNDELTACLKGVEFVG
jgi:hypothetical protein